MEKFTEEQKFFIASKIDDWYVEWRYKLIDFGYAKELLKAELLTDTWEREPNFLEFIDDLTKYKCFVVRNTDFGYLCGYVQITKEHKLHNKSLEEIEKLEIDVHRGITYANKSLTKFAKEKEAIYCIGFDCAHAEDLLPYNSNMRGEYRNIEYVTNECKKLAKQLKIYE